ncbi:filamentous hemagglutinin N-terminal domain-containing protein, partial [Janthinobacterium sp.]|uniref:filamentous hemagglutinin N-terminal domain-containing protein n=1 Tax=Janthinobacterium sp. TaxID=1871054 RepID=UPI00293D70B6
IGNLNLAAQIIARQQAAQAAARAAAQGAPATQPEGLGAGALQVDSNSLSKGWLNARAPQQSSAAGNTLVQIEQTADKAILNWESFNVGKNTTLEFKQQAAWSVLNRVNDPLARPSQIQGQIKADGTVMIVNRNGIVFGGASQVNTRNLVAAAVGMGDAKFRAGLYSEALGSGLAPALANDLVVQANAAAYTKATADVVVAAGARIETRAPQSVTEGGGYVLLAGRGVENGGAISTPGGQTTLAAGDAFSIAKGVGSDANQNSSTRGNIVAPLSVAAGAADGGAGLVRNRGLVQASTGDISLNGRSVEQAGVLLSSTSVTTRGSIHLNALGDPKSAVTLASGGLSAILLDDKGATALDVQRGALLKDSVLNSDGFYDRRDQSLVQIRSSADVQFQDASLTLATGGQVLVEAARRSQVEKGAAIDVSGAVGVALAMASNNVLINVQGNEQRDAAVNRDGKKLNSVDMWIDQRALTLVPAGTNGYPTDRWYTGGGLLEVSGYLNTNPHGIGEWAAQGGSVVFGGAELVTRAGSNINVAGGSLNVQGGTVKQTWLKGADGQLYNLASAPADVLYDGVYRGFEDKHARWGDKASRYFFNSLVTPREQYENGYTVGRDAGRVVVATGAAVLEGGIDASVFQGERQQRARDAGADGYRQAQTAAARAGQLVLGALRPVYDSASGMLRDSPTAQVERIRVGKAPAAAAPGLADALAPALAGNIALDADWLNGLGLGGLGLYASGAVSVDAAVRVAAGGAIALHATEVAVNADLGARGGSIALGNIVGRYTSAAGGSWVDSGLVDIRPDGYRAAVRIQPGATLDTRGLWSNLLLQREAIAGLPYVDGGAISILSSGDVALGAGSALDASSGAALQSDGSLRGGRGGNVTLKARQSDPHYDDAGLLALDGRISGEGVKGGGRLTIESGRGVLIGAAQNGAAVLAAGARGEVALRLAEDFHIAAGELIPMDIALTVSQLKPGQTVLADTSTNVSSVNPLTIAAPWRVPARVSVQSAAGKMYYEGSLVPPGTVLFGLSQLPAGYVVPAAVFPIGVPIPPVTTRYEAGKLAAEAIVIPTGYAIAAGASLPRAVAVDPLATLDPALFHSGFSAYTVGAHDGLAVAPGGRVEVTMPLLRADLARAAGIAGGAEAGAALERWTPPLWQENAAAGKLTQRAGADLNLYAGNLYNRGPLLVGEGAAVTLDPGRALTLQANSQISVEGALLAPGGRISILPGGFGTGNDVDKPDGRPNPTSIWIGAGAALDVAGLAHTARDSAGRRYGRADKGGTIEIGARHQLDATQVEAADAFLVLRPGARLEASGAAATVDLAGAGATVLAGDGGVIALSSARGLHLDGAMRAAAGG